MEKRVVRAVFGETPPDLLTTQSVARCPKLGKQLRQRQVPGQSLGHWRALKSSLPCTECGLLPEGFHLGEVGMRLLGAGEDLIHVSLLWLQ